MKSPVLETIRKRRSIREYTDRPVGRETLHAIIEAGMWAPSGLNNQPWRFVTVVDPEIRAQLAEQTRYGHIIRDAPSLIVVFLDEHAMYDPVKDRQAAGACIQNMLLAVEALGLGAVWLGQILQNKEEVNRILGLSGHLELMAVLAVGEPRHRNQSSTRKPMDELLLKEL